MESFLILVVVVVVGLGALVLILSMLRGPSTNGSRRERMPIVNYERNNCADQVFSDGTPVRFHSKVAGITHRNDDGTSRQAVISCLRRGSRLVLIPEPTNRFDKNAVKVCDLEGRQLGYLPAETAEMLSIRDEDPHSFAAEVGSFYSAGEDATGVTLKLAKASDFPEYATKARSTNDKAKKD